MNCKEVLALQTAYMDEDLSKKEMKAIHSHLKTCDACRREFDAMEDLLKTLSTLDDIPVPENLADEILAVIKRGPEKEKRVFVLPRFLRSWQTYSVAAACILLFTAVSTDIKQRAAMTNTAYIYTSESIAPRAVEIPVSLTEDAPTESPTPSPAVTVRPAPLLNIAGATTGNSGSNLPANYTAPITATETDTASVPSAPVTVTEKSNATGSAASGTFKNTTPAKARATSPLDSKTEQTVSSPAPTVKPSASPKATAEPKTTSAPKTYSTVSSLVKRRVTFVVDEAGAKAVFDSSKSGGVTAVKNALHRAGYEFSTRESVVEELATAYNALVKEANDLSAKIAAGNTSLRSQLSKKEAEMQALQNTANTPSLTLAFE